MFKIHHNFRMENDLTRSIDFNDVIDSFAAKQAHRNLL